MGISLKNLLATEGLDNILGVSFRGRGRIGEPIITDEVDIEPFTPLIVDLGMTHLGFGFRVFLLKEGGVSEFIIFTLGKQSFGFIGGFSKG